MRETIGVKLAAGEESREMLAGPQLLGRNIKEIVIKGREDTLRKYS